MNEIKHKIKIETFKGVNYIVVAVGNDSKAKDYIEGNVPCNSFRLPAIKEGDTPNEDGYFPLHQITYDKNTAVKVVSAVIIQDKYGAAFYDDSSAEVYYTDKDVERFDGERFGCIRCHVVGCKSQEKYYHAIWNYFVKEDNATGR